MALSGAEKVRRHRARKRRGEAVLPIKVNVGAVAELLIDHRMLREWDAHDRDKVREALEAAMRLWTTYDAG